MDNCRVNKVVGSHAGLTYADGVLLVVNQYPEGGGRSIVWSVGRHVVFYHGRGRSVGEGRRRCRGTLFAGLMPAGCAVGGKEGESKRGGAAVPAGPEPRARPRAHAAAVMERSVLRWRVPHRVVTSRHFLSRIEAADLQKAVTTFSFGVGAACNVLKSHVVTSSSFSSPPYDQLMCLMSTC